MVQSKFPDEPPDELLEELLEELLGELLEELPPPPPPPPLELELELELELLDAGGGAHPACGPRGPGRVHLPSTDSYDLHVFPPAQVQPSHPQPMQLIERLKIAGETGVVSTLQVGNMTMRSLYAQGSSPPSVVNIVSSTSMMVRMLSVASDQYQPGEFVLNKVFTQPESKITVSGAISMGRH